MTFGLLSNLLPAMVRGALKSLESLQKTEYLRAVSEAADNLITLSGSDLSPLSSPVSR
jgi:hypothetical protein